MSDTTLILSIADDLGIKITEDDAREIETCLADDDLDAQDWLDAVKTVLIHSFE